MLTFTTTGEYSAVEAAAEPNAAGEPLRGCGANLTGQSGRSISLTGRKTSPGLGVAPAECRSRSPREGFLRFFPKLTLFG